MPDPCVVADACEESLNSGPAATNAAVARCCEAYLRAWRVVLATNQGDDDNEYGARKAAVASYSAALPPLSSPDDLRDFIACIAHGMLLEIIEEARGSRLLYAAQVAPTASPPLPKPKSTA